jgi:hypothetical protein
MNMKVSIVGLLLAIVSGYALTDTLWDGAVSVAGVSDGPKAWLTCPKGTSFKANPGIAPERKCFIKGVLTDEERGVPKRVSAQELLATHFQPPTGFDAVAVGVLPELAIGANSNYYNTTTVLVAYRLAPKN